MVYLDNAATTYPKPEVVYRALDEANRTLAFNAGRGSYKESSEAFQLIEKTREKVGSIVGKDKSSVIFASSATEALNQIIYGLSLKEGDTVLVSPFEHNAVMRPLHLLEKNIGIKIEQIPFCLDTWELEIEKFQSIVALRRPKAVFVSQISNVTGYLLPYKEIFEITSETAINVLDASQGFGIVPIKDKKNIDYVVFAGHKSLYASFGIGGFVFMRNDKLCVHKAGGTGSDSLNMDMGERGFLKYEAGSPNIVAIAGLNASVSWLEIEDVFNKERVLFEYLSDQLRSLKKIHIYAPEKHEDSLFGVISFSVEGYTPDDVGTILYDEFGIAVRTGYHCAPLIHDFIGSKGRGGTVRVSLGAFVSQKDIDLLIEGLRSL